MNLLTRRIFLKNSFLSSVIFLTCSGELFGAITPTQTLSTLHKDLFPSSSFIPDVSFINADIYLSKIFTHSRIKDEDKEFIHNGVRWLNEESVDRYKKVYTKLSSQKRQDLLNIIAKTRWGEAWLHNVMMYMMEAMLGDPIYGGNVGELGWKWLNHKAGEPRPTKAYV
jgi:sorbitol-specific phosphotransferase system component IIBC